MAIAGLSVKSGAKGKATAHASYVARTGSYERYLERGEVLEASNFGNMPDWAAHDPSAFWKASDAYERANGSSYREFQISLPRELNTDQRRDLVEQFLKQEIGDTHAYQYAIHVPKASDGLENPHVHLMFSERRLDGIDRDPEQYFKRYNAAYPERGGARKGFGQQPGMKLTRVERAEELKALRDRWEGMVNHSLEIAGSDARVNMKSYVDRGLDITPEPKQLPSAWRGEGRAATLAFRAARKAELAVRRDPSTIVERVSAMKAQFTRQDLYRELSKVTDDEQVFAEVKAKIDVHPSLVAFDTPGTERGSSTELLTTREMIECEQSLAALGDAMIEKRDFGLHESVVGKALTTLSFELSSEQVGAVRHATGDERLSLVSGVAGAGKSTMLSVVRDAYESAGYRVSGMALAGKAADELTKSSGIDSRTIASWLYRHKQGDIQLTAKDVVVLDEAGMVNSSTMERVLDAVNQAGAKAILVGDAEQLQPIQAGVPFLALTADHETADITQVRRQSVEWQRQATEDLSRKAGGHALANYREAECVHEGFGNTLVPQVVERYLDKADDLAIILAHRKVDVTMLNEAVRAERKVRGELSDAKPFTESLELAIGDRVVFGENNKTLGVLNGQFGQVVDFKGGQVSVQRENGSVVQFRASEYDKLQHGYASTIHKAQGMTVDRAVVWGSASLDRHLLYVAMSRHRDRLDVYQPIEATRVRSLEACLERSNRSATIASTMISEGLSLEEDEAGRLSLKHRYPTAVEVEEASEKVAAIRATIQSTFEAQQAAFENAAKAKKDALQAHKDAEPSDKLRHLVRSSHLQAREDWENKLPVLERAARQAGQALQAWHKQVERGESLEILTHKAIIREAPDAKKMLKENGERIELQESVRKFLTLEKTLQSNPDRSQRRLAEQDQKKVVGRIVRDKSSGLFSERLKSAVKREEKTQAREHGRSRGGLEL